MLSKHDLAGQTFGRLTVIAQATSRPYASGPKAYWLCRCQCGHTKEISASLLRKGETRSCGCLQRETVAARMTTHGHTRGSANKNRPPEYITWANMLARCSNPTNRQWADYGGRGITVCDRWYDFAAFLADMGRRPSPKHTIERANNGLGYSPTNCCWAPMAVQSRNTRRTRMITFNGETRCMRDWADHLGLSYGALKSRLYRGWPLELALTKGVG